MDKLSATADGEAGFTLVEMLVALALLASIFSTIVAAMSLAMSASSRANQASEQVALAIANRLLREMISAAMPLYVRSHPTERPALRFSGGGRSIQFVSNFPGRTTVGGVHDAALRWQPSAGKANERTRTGNLIIQVAPHRPLPIQDGIKPQEAAHALIQKIAFLKFSYFGRKASAARRRWHSSWQNVNHLPELVAIELKFKEADRRNWPITLIKLIHGQSRPEKGSLNRAGVIELDE